MQSTQNDEMPDRETADIIDAAASESPVRAWWERSASLAACAAVAIGAATVWFGGMLGRVPLDAHSTLGYLLMLPLLLIVPAFSLAALRLAWAAWLNPTLGMRDQIPGGNPMPGIRVHIYGVALLGALLNIVAIARFAMALARIFSK